jgi:hypothetical protein
MRRYEQVLRESPPQLFCRGLELKISDIEHVIVAVLGLGLAGV